MELVERAIVFATNVHAGMRRKQSTLPYILHPVEVAAIVGSITSNQDVIAAGILHDVVEDTETPIQEIEKNFGARVAQLVATETEDKRKELPADVTWKVRKEEALEILKKTNDIDVKILFLGDKLSNIRSIYSYWQKEGHNLWQHFNEKDPVQQKWYYYSILNYTKELADTLAWKEYNWLVQEIFKNIPNINEEK